MRLAAERLAFGYPGHTVGAGAALSVEPGEVLCLLGPNGSGKTTLFKTLLGLLPPHAGRVLVDGRALAALSVRERAAAIAYVPQAQALPFPFEVREVVLMGCSGRLGLFETPGPRHRAAAESALERLGIGELASRTFTRLSGGQRQLVLIARALVQDTPLMVLDEPTASLDFGNQARVLEEVRRLADAGLGVVLSTHDPDHAFAIGDRVALLREGRIVAQGAVAETLTEERLSGLYGVPVSLAHLPGGGTVCSVVPGRVRAGE